MSRSSTKNLLATSFFAAAFSLFAAPALGAKYSYELLYDAKYGVHTFGEPNVATNRHVVEYSQTTEYSPEWLIVAGGRAEVEAAYGALPERYGSGDVAKYESQTFFPRDIYLQFKSGSFRGRLGYQQVVWGEAFGLYYADIVNPKDYRNAGLGDLARNRLDIPMANLQWIFSESSIQLLYIPIPMFNMIPSSGSDFNGLLLPPGTPAATLTIDRKATNPPTQGEFGVRIGKQFGGFDTSIFYLNYFDRMPVYGISILPTTPLTIRATPMYKPLRSAGATMTVDLEGYLLRTELIQHFDREQNITSGTSVSTAKSNELVYVIGVDMPPQNKWQAGVQFAESRLSSENWMIRKPTQTSLAARIAKEFPNQIAIETLATYYSSDASSLIQASISLPLSSQSELLFGADIFNGDATSELGRFKNGSRAWVMFKTSIKKQ